LVQLAADSRDVIRNPQKNENGHPGGAHVRFCILGYPVGETGRDFSLSQLFHRY